METLFIGKNLLFLHEVESTNTYAMNLLRNVNGIEGTVIYTDNQTQGKGQRGTVWSSSSGQNITTSIVLKPLFLGSDDAFLLSKISALAVYDVMTEMLPVGQYDIKIKWPNDILVNQKKVAGILIENNYVHSHIQYAVIGIGLNVNQTIFDDFMRAATSLKVLANKEFDRAFVLERLCVYLEKWYFKLKAHKHFEIDECYLGCLFGFNEWLCFEDADKVSFKGKVRGVAKSGKLMLELDGCVIREFDMKELRFL
jgi:BirA family transcriptional regulator, biotin operon repressor / biotin---[acetyl-CoA-carboxylase] ligase